MKFKVTNSSLITFNTCMGRISAYGHNAIHFERKHGKEGDMQITPNEAIKLLQSYNLKIT